LGLPFLGVAEGGNMFEVDANATWGKAERNGDAMKGKTERNNPRG